MQAEALAIAFVGGQRYALPQSTVRAIARRRDAAVRSLAELLDLPAGSDEDVVVTLCHVSIEFSVRVQHLDLRPSLPFLPLPSWFAAVVQNVVRGVVIDGDELVPYIDLAPLAHDLFEAP